MIEIAENHALAVNLRLADDKLTGMGIFFDDGAKIRRNFRAKNQASDGCGNVNGDDGRD